MPTPLHEAAILTVKRRRCVENPRSAAGDSVLAASSHG
jgi:hypothetical protein